MVKEDYKTIWPTQQSKAKIQGQKQIIHGKRSYINGPAAKGLCYDKYTINREVSIPNFKLSQWLPPNWVSKSMVYVSDVVKKANFMSQLVIYLRIWRLEKKTSHR